MSCDIGWIIESLIGDGMPQQKTLYIKFFVGIDANSIMKLTQAVQHGLSRGAERFGLLVSSPGGNVFAGLSGYNFLKGIPAEVVTHNFGSADSIATVLFCAGSRRFSVPHARFLLHGIGFDVTGPARLDERVLDERIKSLRIDRENISRVISDTTGRPLADVERDILEGTVLNSEQARDYGLVHEIRTELFEKGAEVVEIT